MVKGAHLDESVAKCGSSNVTYPHARESSNTHEDKQDHAWFRTSGIEDTRCSHDIQAGFREDGRDRESTDEEHDGRREHLREDVSGLVSSDEVAIGIATDLVESAADRRISASSDDRRTRSSTTRKGTASDVTKSGIAWRAMISELNGSHS